MAPHQRLIAAIRRSGRTIYDDLADRPDIFLDTESLESILLFFLKGLSLNYPLRTRSKILKSKVCEALGYPVPLRFKKTKPRFPGQNLDTYVQKSDNLQIWNEEVSPSRRYAIIRVGEDNRVSGVRVVEGRLISSLDTTGTLTQKYQAKTIEAVSRSVLVSQSDTSAVQKLLLSPKEIRSRIRRRSSEMARPDPSDFIPIGELYRKLMALAGYLIPNPGPDQERRRGTMLHKAVCVQVGGPPFSDKGQFPDLPYQLLEVKLQTSPTVDLGLVSPDGEEPLGSAPGLRHCDVRYALFYGTTLGKDVRLDHLVLTTGADFFTFFRRFEGRVVNKKLQIPLPGNFFT